ncbi:MAG: hypothetical protein H6824_16895 [Planctomycetaceae bacterium]|nr:hypothetical protein [Planctomycetaceae bacterium]
MDGSRIRSYLTGDVAALLATYKHFETLVPHDKHAGSAHTGEDGRYVEALIRGYLRKYLPQHLEVCTGFILRTAVKTGENGRERRGDKDAQSTQLDIIVYDSANYPVFQRLGDDVIVPPEGVVAICSVKKHLRVGNIKAETKNLRRASELCRCLTQDGAPRRGPFLSLMSMGIAKDWSPQPSEATLWEEIKDGIDQSPSPKFDDLIGYIGILGTSSVFKARPKNGTPNEARFVWHDHQNNQVHLGLQFMLTGILSVYYDESRHSARRPGFTGFESGRPHEKELGTISVDGMR